MGEIADRHRRWAAGFSDVVAGVRDWGAPTPVAEWDARGVVRHLVEWPTGLLRSHGSSYDVPALPPVEDDPAATWLAHRDAVQALLEDPQASGEVLATPMFGDVRTDELLDRLYSPDVFMHTWDLARASGQPHGLDEEQCARLLAGMGEVEDLIRSSGQFGDEQPTPADATPAEALMAFLGRDPRWTPPPA